MNAYPNKAKFDNSSPKKLLNFDQVFKDVKILGAGGFGETHLVADVLSGKKYALKLLHPKGFDKMSFYREVSALINLSASPNCNPNIVCYYNHFVVQGYTNYQGQFIKNKYYGILTEYINGVTLAQFDKLNRLTVNDIIYIGLWTLSMLKYLHRRGFAHNDISDANIMVTHDKKLKLIDLGLTCYSNTNSYLKCKLVAFNKFYASPEMISEFAESNFNKYSKTSDVYAVGMLIYNLLTGKRPYRESNDKIISAYQPIGIPCIDEALRNMLRINPNQRATSEQAYQLLKRC